MGAEGERWGGGGGGHRAICRLTSTESEENFNLQARSTHQTCYRRHGSHSAEGLL